jgi:D-arginine dehydrogenase
LAKPRAVLMLAPAAQAAVLADKRRTALGLRDEPDWRAMVPAIRAGYAAEAGLAPDCFHKDVAALHQGFLRQVTRQGWTIALDTRIASLRRADGVWHAMAKDGTTLIATIVVNAAGACADDVAGSAGEPRIGMQPGRRTADPAPRPLGTPASLASGCSQGAAPPCWARPTRGTRPVDPRRFGG